MDKPQATSKKEPVGRISKFTVPMKITPTKPASKVAPKRIALSPAPVKPSVVNPTAIESTSHASPFPAQNAQPVTSTAGLQPSPAAPKRVTLMPGQGQLNASNDSAASPITPRRVSLLPAVNNQANKSPDENKPTAQVPPRRIALTPVDTISTSNKATTVPEPNSVPGHTQTPEIMDCKGSSSGDEPSVSTTSPVDAGTRETNPAQTQTIPNTAPRRVPLTTLATDVGKGCTNKTSEPSQPPAASSKTDFKESETFIHQGVSRQEKAKENISSCTNTEPSVIQPTSVVKPDTTANSSQPRRIALTLVPMETQSACATSLVDKENNKVNQLPNTNDQLQPRRVTLTTLTPLGSENTPIEQQQNSSKKCQAPRRPIPLEPTVIVLDD